MDVNKTTYQTMLETLHIVYGDLNRNNGYYFVIGGRSKNGYY